MPKQIFDQERPRSAMAQRLDEAFAGCDEWTLAPASRRRDDLDLPPWSSAGTQPAIGASRPLSTEARAA